MHLQEISHFSPPKHAFFVNSEHIVLDLHPSGNYIAFSTRSHELILRNQQTGRSCVLYRSEHGIIDAKFTSDLLLVVEKGFHEIIAFSLKTDKVKKRISGHRTQILRLSYCRQRKLFCSISHDVCMVFNENTLNREKMLKCQTSSFVDCLFSPSGQYLFTAFKDSTVFLWEITDFSHRQYSLWGGNLNLASNYTSYLAAFNAKTIFISDFSRKDVSFQELQPFWSDRIIKVDFIDTILVVQTQSSFYLSQVYLEHRFVSKKISLINSDVNSFCIGGYGSLIMLLLNDCKKIQIMNVMDDKGSIYTAVKNPLKNQGLYCCGGYGQEKGCDQEYDIKMSHPYQTNEIQLQNLHATNYQAQTNAQFSIPKLREFLKKHHIFPDKHRAAIYQFLLMLPINPSEFRELERKGRHESVELLDAKYPLDNKAVAESLKNVISLLAHHNALFGYADNIPAIAFPFVCLFGNDQFLCFEVMYRLLNNTLGFLFSEFPTANSYFLQNCHEIFQSVDRQVLNHLNSNKLSFSKLCWGMLENFFTTILPREAFLAVTDCLIAHANEQSLIMFMILAYLVYNRTRILTISTTEQLDHFLDNQHTVNTGKYLKIVYKLYQAHKHKVTYQFQGTDFALRSYRQITNFPKQAVMMYGGRRNLKIEEYRKTQDEEKHKERLMREMEAMTLEAKRNSQRQKIQQQAYLIHEEAEKRNNDFQMKNPEREERIRRIERLINQLTQSIESEEEKNQFIKSYCPVLGPTMEARNDLELDQLEEKLMQSMTLLRPHYLNQPLTSQPISLAKGQINKQNQLKASMKAKVAQNLWEIDSLQAQNQRKKWQKDMLKSMKT